MKVVRTPEKRFENLPGWSFEPRFIEIGDLRFHYVDEGSSAAGGGSTVLLLHGEPTWSYLYRKMIPPLVAAGHRAIALDFAGFGRSDKPESREDYTYRRHIDWTKAFIEKLDLKEVVLFGQDWGGLIGLRVVTELPDRFARIIAANTFLPTGDPWPNQAFFRWRDFSQSSPDFPVGRIVNGGCTSELSEEVIAAYDAPFPDESFKSGPRQFPLLVPASTEAPESQENSRAWAVLQRWDKPFLTIFSDSDPVTAGGDRDFQDRVPGARNQPHSVIEGAAHFLQEDKGEEIAEAMVRWLGSGSA